MKRLTFYVTLSLVVSTLPIFGQQIANDSQNTLRFENGVIANGVYSNPCFGFSFVIPTGWKVSPITASGRARHAPGDGLTLLVIYQETDKPQANTISLHAFDADAGSLATQEFVSKTAHRFIENVYLEKRELIYDSFPVDYGDRTFYRADTKWATKDFSRHLAYLYTRFRGYFIGGVWWANSRDELDKMLAVLKGISFQEDRIDPRCSMENDNQGGVISGILSSHPTPPGSASSKPLRVRISQGVSTGLLLTKVQPAYPDDARQAGIQGLVVLRAEIDDKGNVKDLALVSGHPMLAPAAMGAVRQWKYRPYLLNGQPVNVETQVIVSFTLVGK